MSRVILPIATSRETSALLWQIVRGRRGPLVVAGLAFAGAGLCGLVAPWVLGDLVDAARGGDGADVVTRAFFLIAGAALVGGLLTSLSIAWLARSGEPAVADLRELVLERAVHLEASRIEEAGAGDLLSRVGDDVRTVADSLSTVVPLLVNSVITIGFTAVGLFALDWRLGIAGLAAAPMYWLSLRWYLPRSSPFYRAERVAQGERAEALIGGMHGAATLRDVGMGPTQLRVIDHYSMKATTLSFDVFRLFGRFIGRNNRAELVGLLTILVGGFLLVDGSLVTVGEVTAAALYFHRLFNPVGALVAIFDDVQSTGASLARLAGVARLPTVLALPVPRQDATAGLRLHGVRHAYTGDRWVVRDVDAEIARGETVALVGATGAGKTTLAAIAAGIFRPRDGSVTLGGADLTTFDPPTLRSRIALISQEVHVFSGSVRDNLLLARPDADDADLRHALDLALSTGWIDALPRGLDTTVGDHGHRLTPAQGQQLALARIALLDPEVVVLDEATAEAGSSGARNLERAARAVVAGRTALVVAHRLTQAQSADRVLVMADGEVVEDGSHDELVAAGGRYATLWAAWSTP